MVDLTPQADQPTVPTLHLNLLGGLTILIDGQPITDIATRKAEALLIYLACNPQPQQREALAELFWDDLPAERAAGNLRLILNQLRKRLDPFLDITRQTIALRPDARCTLDVQCFARALDSKPLDADVLAGALALYQGDFLHGFYVREACGFSEWQSAQVEHWRARALEGMQRLVDRLIAYSRYAEAQTWATRLLSLDPLDEAAHRQLMLLHMRSGQRQAAVRQYQACQRRLAKELGLEPEPATQALYQRIRSMPAQRPHTLPPCPAAPLGRADELARLYEWLARPPTRLMTIVGMGGSGKTHLALTVGWRVANEYLGPCDDGVFYLALIAGDSVARHEDDATLLMEIAKTLQITLSGKRALLDQIVQHLRDKAVLLIVDNAELLGRAARLALSALIQHTAAVRVLAPSRERLRLSEEQVLDLEGLAYLALPTHAVTAQLERQLCARIPAYASAQLFLEYARRLQGICAFEAYALPEQLAIGRICQLVHGLPLAIQLVTPWLRMFSPPEVLRELTQMIDLLATDAPDLPERHRSIRAVFDYSWRLLAEPERHALAALAVFPDSFTTEAAAAITAVTLPVLAALRDTSLLGSAPVAAQTRHVLHPLVRRLALEKLQADPATEARIRQQHARYFADFAAQREKLLHDVQGAATLREIEREIWNLRAGWCWASAAGDIETLGRYSITFHDFCTIRGWEIEGLNLFQHAAATVRDWAALNVYTEASVTAAVRVLICCGGLEYTLGHLAAAETVFQQSRVLLNAMAVEDSPELMYIYKQLGMIAYQRGHYDQAMSYLRFTLSIAEEGEDRTKLGDTLLSMGFVALAQGDGPQAEQTLARSLAVYQALGSTWGIAHTTRLMGVLAMERGDRATAAQQYQHSLALMRQLEHRVGEALVLDQQGLLYLAKQQFESSQAALQQALTIFQELGVEAGTVRALGHLGRLMLTTGQAELAQQYYLQANEIAQRTQMPALQIESAAYLLQLLLDTHADASLMAEICAALDSLRQHPACTADMRRYIGPLVLRCAADTTYAAGMELPWPLNRILQSINIWIRTLRQRCAAVGQSDESLCIEGGMR